MKELIQDLEKMMQEFDTVGKTFNDDYNRGKSVGRYQGVKYSLKLIREYLAATKNANK